VIQENTYRKSQSKLNSPKENNFKNTFFISKQLKTKKSPKRKRKLKKNFLNKMIKQYKTDLSIYKTYHSKVEIKSNRSPPKKLIKKYINTSFNSRSFSV
jgi:hypothetical protein